MALDQHRPFETWQIRKPAVSSAYGVVASHHRLSSEVGASVLAAGGNAIDAAIATSLHISTVEPWMSGLGGGGYMLVYIAEENKVYSIDGGMRASRHLDPADYPIAAGADADLFGWPGVLEDRNVHGPLSVAVPTLASGLDLAGQNFGSMPLAELVQPAIDSAQLGMAVSWYNTLIIASAAALLRQYRSSEHIYLPNGLPPSGDWMGELPVIRLTGLADTLARIQQAGFDDFYRGELAGRLAADLSGTGCRVSREDLAEVRAGIREADTQSYRDASVFTAPGLTAGPTLRHCLSMMADDLEPTPRPSGAYFSAIISALKSAYADRLETLGDNDDARSPGCTTHLSVCDRHGNMVALTQTLLSLFGSRLVMPDTGLLMNNGVMWFDPRPGSANAIAAGRRPLSNMCPTMFRHRNRMYATGASGGRRILPSVLQLLSLVIDCGQDIETAMHQPRIDESATGQAFADNRLAAQILDEIAANHPVAPGQAGVFPALFACPNIVSHDPQTGQSSGVAFVSSPAAAVCAAER